MNDVIIRIHEDDEGLSNIYPAEGFEQASADLDKSIQASVENRAPNGAGWKDMHIIETPEVTFVDKGLRADVLGRAMEKVLPRAAKYQTTPDDYYARRIDNPHCYGLGNQLFFMFETQGEFVKYIWFVMDDSTPHELLTMRLAMNVINDHAPAMISDYRANSDGLMSDTNFMDRYFDHLLSGACEPALTYE